MIFLALRPILDQRPKLLNLFRFRFIVLIPLTFLIMTLENTLRKAIFLFLLCVHRPWDLWDPVEACNSSRQPKVEAETSEIDESYTYDVDESEHVRGDLQTGGFNVIDLHLHSKVLGLLITILIVVGLSGCLLYFCKQHCCKLKCCKICCEKDDTPSAIRREDLADPPVRFSDVARLQEEFHLRQPMIRQRQNYFSNRLQLLPSPQSYDIPLQNLQLASPPISDVSNEPIYLQLAASQPQPTLAANADPIYSVVPPRQQTGAIPKAPAPPAPQQPAPAPLPGPRTSASSAASSTAKKPASKFPPPLQRMHKEKESSL